MVRGPASLVHQSPFSPLAHVQRKKGEDEFTSPVCSDEQTAVVCPVGGGRRDACPTLDNFVGSVGCYLSQAGLGSEQGGLGRGIGRRRAEHLFDQGEPFVELSIR